ncbi:MAG TPA: erythromycin esterase family protein, partial [Vicinamibacterales bacterium]|nr:erythromycin esterase family protein [Vicinamibacterales bacterium]
LTFRGFDPQISSRSGITTRPAFFRRLIAPLDQAYADEVFAFDAMVIERFNATYARSEEARLVAFYEQLTEFLEFNRERLRLFAGNEAPVIAGRAAWSMVQHVQQLRSFLADQNDASLNGHMAIRDGAMADNITTLAGDLYPDKKIIIWAANIHVRHASEQTTWVFPTMGKWLAERFRDELYTIGIYPNRGQVSTGSRTVSAIEPAPDGTMEHLLMETRAPLMFLDLLHAPREAGTEWMFQATPTRDAELFTTGMRTVPIVPRDQYDGILLFDEVSAPRFLMR